MERERSSGQERRPWGLRRIAVVAALSLLLVVAWRLRTLLLLVFAAVLFAVLLRTLASLIARATRLGPGLSLAAAVLSLGGSVALVGWLAGAQLATQLRELAELLPEAWRAVEQRIGDLRIDESLEEWLRRSLPSGTAVLGQIRSAAALVGSAVTGLLLAIVGGIYFAAQPALYRRGVLALVPPAHREAVGRVYDLIAVSLGRWLLMQLAAMAVVGTVTGVALWMLGVPSPLALGLAAGLLEFVPVVGPILAAIPALLVAFTVRPGLVLWVALAFVVIQQVESNLLTPLLARRVVSVPPALMLFALVAFGALFGPLGVVLAAPLLVIVFVVVRDVYIGHALEEQPLPSPPAGEQNG